MAPMSWTPFSAGDEELARHLADLSVPTLLLSCVHITGDLSILDGPYQPHGLMANEEQGFMSPEEQSAARAFALELIKEYRDRGCPPLKPIPAEGLRRMMSWAACEPIDDTYLPMVLEEIGFAENNPVSSAPPAARADFPVIVVGCGESGLLAAIKLKEAGFAFEVIEKNPGIGGTWFENSYPGARVDSPNHLYTYSFEPIDHWTRYF